MKKVINQLLIEETTPIKLEKLHIVLLTKMLELQDNAVKKAQEQYELFNSLNPSYIEEALTPKEAQIKLDAMNARSNQGLIRPY